MDAKGAPGVCVVTQPLSSAGERATSGLVDILSELTTVTVLTPNLPTGSTLPDQCRVIELSESGTGTSIAVQAVRFILNQVRMASVILSREEPVILFFGPTSYVLPIVIAKLAGKTVVLEPRGDVPLTLRLNWERRLPAPIARLLAGSVWTLERLGFLLADAIITYTPGVAEQLRLGRFEHKLYTDGARYVDVRMFYPRIPFKEREEVIGFLGRLDEEKGIRTLAEFANRLPEGVTFRFVGDGNLREWLEDELGDAYSTGDVEIAGWVDHERVPDELSRMRLLLLPSRPTEGLPTVVLEAMACGTPVLATPYAGTSDVIVDGQTGFLIHDPAPGELLSRVEAILGREDLDDISDRGLEVIRSTYRLEAAQRRYAEMLQDIAGSTNH